MKTPESKKENPILTQIADKLTETQQELDELMVQFALGKAEARDKFEELKTAFKNWLSRWQALRNGKELNEVTARLNALVNELELQLSLGLAETKEVFEEQRKRITKSIESLEGALNENLKLLSDTDIFHELEKFKLKLEVIRLRFVLKKFAVKDSFREKLNAARLKASRLTAGIQNKLENKPDKLENFKDEIQLAYKHLRKAFDSF